MSRTSKEQREALRADVMDAVERAGDRTHWDGCLLAHPECAVLALLDDLEEAEGRARKAEEAAAFWENGYGHEARLRREADERGSDYAKVADAYLVLVRCESCEKPRNRGYVCIHCGWDQ